MLAGLSPVPMRAISAQTPSLLVLNSNWHLTSVAEGAVYPLGVFPENSKFKLADSHLSVCDFGGGVCAGSNPFLNPA